MKDKIRLTTLSAGFSGILNGIEEFYNKSLHKWKLEVSDQVFEDGKELSREEVFLRKMSFHYDDYKDLQPSGLRQKKLIKDDEFVRDELERVRKNLSCDIIMPEPIRVYDNSRNRLDKQRLLDKINEYKEYLEEKLKGKPKETQINNQTLRDIWKGGDKGKEEYDKIIDLMTDNKTFYDSEVGECFLTKKDGRVIWKRIPKKTPIQYMAGFTYVCIHKGWIEYISGKKMMEIFENTFGVNIGGRNPFDNLNIDGQVNQVYRNFFEKIVPENKNTPT